MSQECEGENLDFDSSNLGQKVNQILIDEPIDESDLRNSQIGGKSHSKRYIEKKEDEEENTWVSNAKII